MSKNLSFFKNLKPTKRKLRNQLISFLVVLFIFYFLLFWISPSLDTFLRNIFEDQVLLVLFMILVYVGVLLYLGDSFKPLKFNILNITLSLIITSLFVFMFILQISFFLDTKFDTLDISCESVSICTNTYDHSIMEFQVFFSPIILLFVYLLISVSLYNFQLNKENYKKLVIRLFFGLILILIIFVFIFSNLISQSYPVESWNDIPTSPTIERVEKGNISKLYFRNPTRRNLIISNVSIELNGTIIKGCNLVGDNVLKKEIVTVLHAGDKCNLKRHQRVRISFELPDANKSSVLTVR